MNYLITLWRRFWCRHNYAYVMRMVHDGKAFNTYECSRCFSVKYEVHRDEDYEYRDLGKP